MTPYGSALRANFITAKGGSEFSDLDCSKSFSRREGRREIASQLNELASVSDYGFLDAFDEELEALDDDIVTEAA